MKKTMKSEEREISSLLTSIVEGTEKQSYRNEGLKAKMMKEIVTNTKIPTVVAVNGDNKLIHLIVYDQVADKLQIIQNAMDATHTHYASKNTGLQKYRETYGVPLATAYLIMLMDYGLFGFYLTAEDKKYLTNEDVDNYDTTADILTDNQSRINFGSRKQPHISYFTFLMRKAGVLSGNNLSKLPSVVRAHGTYMYGNIIEYRGAIELCSYKDTQVSFDYKEGKLTHEAIFGVLTNPTKGKEPVLASKTQVSTVDLSDGKGLLELGIESIKKEIRGEHHYYAFTRNPQSSLTHALYKVLYTGRLEEHTLRKLDVAETLIKRAKLLINKHVTGLLLGPIQNVTATHNMDVFSGRVVSDLLSTVTLLKVMPTIDSLVSYLDAQIAHYGDKLQFESAKLLRDSAIEILQSALEELFMSNENLQALANESKELKDRIEDKLALHESTIQSMEGDYVAINLRKYLSKMPALSRESLQLLGCYDLSNYLNNTYLEVMDAGVPLTAEGSSYKRYNPQKREEEPFYRQYGARQYRSAVDSYHDYVRRREGADGVPTGFYKSYNDAGNLYSRENLLSPHKAVIAGALTAKNNRKLMQLVHDTGTETEIISLLEKAMTLELHSKGIKKLGKKFVALFGNKYRMDALLTDKVPSLLLSEGYLSDFLDVGTSLFTESMLKWANEPENKLLFTSSMRNLRFALSNNAVNRFLKSVKVVRELSNGAITEANVRTILEYIFTDCVIRQHVPDPFGEYADYLTSYLALVNAGYRSWDAFELRPTSLRLNHDIITSEDRELSGGISDAIFLSRYNDINETKFTEVIHELPIDGVATRVKLIAPSSNEQLKQEGTALSHCVGSYGSRIKEGTCLVLFLRKESNLEESYLTVEFTTHHTVSGVSYRLGQVQGYGNKVNVPNDLKRALQGKVSELNNAVANKAVFKNARKKVKKDVDILVGA